MSQVVINIVDPLSTPRASVLSDIDFRRSVNDALIKLPKGTGARACDMTSSELGVLMKKKEKIEKFKKDTVLYGLAVEFYGELGIVHFEDSRFIIGHGFIYREFLKKNLPLLQRFLDDSRPLAMYGLLHTNDVLKMLNPDEILKESNKSIHDVTYNDVYEALEILRRDDPVVAVHWEGLVSRLTDREDVDEWRGDSSPLRPDCILKRNLMSQHAFRLEAAKFSARRKTELQRQYYERLEKEGLVVTVETFRLALIVTAAVLCAVIALLYIVVRKHGL